MGSSNFDGYDIIVEISEKNLNKQAQLQEKDKQDHKQESISDPIKKDFTTADGTSGTIQLKLLLNEIWLDYTDRLKDSPSKVDRITFKLGILPGDSYLTLNSFNYEGQPLCIPPMKFIIYLTGMISIEDRIEVQNSRDTSENPIPNKKKIIMDFTADPLNPEDPKVDVELESFDKIFIGAIIFKLGLTLDETDPRVQKMLTDIQSALQDGVRDGLVTTAKNISLSDDIAVDPSSTDPFIPHDLAVRTIQDLNHVKENSFAILVQTLGPPPGVNNLDATVSMHSAIPVGQNGAISISSFLILRHVIRKKLIDESGLGLSVDDFDPDKPCTLVRTVATATETGESFHLDSLEAVMEGSHIRISGAISKQTWAYKASGSFTFTISIGPGVNEKGETTVVTTASEPDVDASIEFAPWVYIVSILTGAWLSLIVGVTIFIVLKIVDSILDGLLEEFLFGKIEESTMDLKPVPLGPLGDKLGIATVLLDDLAMSGNIQLKPPFSGPDPSLLVTDSNLKELYVFKVPPQREGSDTITTCYLYNRGKAAVIVNNCSVTIPPTIDQEPKLSLSDISTDMGTIHSVFTQPDLFEIITPMPLTVNPGTQAGVNIRFRPVEAGQIVRHLVINSNDNVRPTLTIPLAAVVTPWPRAQLKVSRTDYMFDGAVGHGSVDYLEIENIGTIDGKITAFYLTNESPTGQFSLQALSPYPYSLAPSQKTMLSIYFNPSHTGHSQAAVVLVMQSAGTLPYTETQTIKLSGDAHVAKIVIEPSLLDFGVLSPGTSKTLSYRIRNDGDWPLTVTGSLLVSSSVKGAFWPDPTETYPFTVTPGASKILQATFYTSGLTAGLPSSDDWELASDDPYQPRSRLLLRGFTGGPRIDIQPDFIEFGIVSQQTVMKEFTINNLGTSELHIEKVSLENGYAFRILNAPTTTQAIGAGSSTKFQVEFFARISGDYIDTLVVKSDDARRPLLRTNRVHARR
jgi:hypothetical protein